MNFDRMRSLLIDRALRGELFSNVTSVVAGGNSLDEEQTTPFTIPNHWQWKRVADCVQFNPKVIQDDAVEVSFIPMADVEPGFVDQCSTRQAKPWAKVKKGFSRFQEGDLLVAKITPCFQNRKSCVAKSLINGAGAGSTEFHVMRCVSDVDAKFLLYFFKSEYFIRYGENHFNGTVGQQRVGAQDIKDCLIPVPPVEEQACIVAKLEEAFAEIDRAEKAYEELQTLAGVFRGQILQEAIQGKLVPQLAEEGVVEQIGDAPKTVPFEIPESWRWVTLASVGKTHTGTTPSTSKKEYFGSDIPFVKPGDIEHCLLTYREDGLSAAAHEVARLVPEKSLLMVCIGGSIGKVAVCDREVSFNQQINAIVCNEELALPEYLFVIMRSPYFQDEVRRNATGTATPIINKSRWGKIWIPLPSTKEQVRIVAKVEDLMKQVDALSIR